MASNSEAILDRAAEIIEKASPQLVLVLTVLSDVIKDIGPKDLGEMAGMIVYEVMETVLFSVVTAPLGGAGGAARLAIAPIKVLRHAAQMEAFANHATTLLKLAGYLENAGDLGTLAKAGNTRRIVDLADEASDTLRGVQAPKGGLASAIKFEGSIATGARNAASLSAEAFGRVFSRPGVQAAYRQIKRAEFDVVFSRAAQPKWADDAGIVLKGFSDPNSRTVTIYLRNLKNADEVAEALAHESRHAMDFLRHGTMTPRGTKAAEIAADLRAWIIANGRRPTSAERMSIIVETLIRIRGGAY